MGCAEQEVDAAMVGTVADVWALVADGGVLPQGVLAAVNLEYAHAATVVCDNDEVAFFPPVTGGSPWA
jgi:molybdopterin synthase sulfur carrier subunit